MSTSTTERPPRREVFTPGDAQEVADYLAQSRQHHRWTRWLMAKQLVTRTLGRARDKAWNWSSATGSRAPSAWSDVSPAGPRLIWGCCAAASRS